MDYLYVVKKICNNIIKIGILIIYKCYLKLGKKNILCGSIGIRFINGIFILIF